MGSGLRRERGLERVTVESSILGVTLLFAIAGVRGLTGNMVFVGFLSLDGLFFMLAAVCGAIVMSFEEASPHGRWVAMEISFFIAGLMTASIILLALAVWGVGGFVTSQAGSPFFGFYLVTGIVAALIALITLVYWTRQADRVTPDKRRDRSSLFVGDKPTRTTL